MKTDRFKHFLEKQKKEMEDYKWHEGEKCGYDPGEQAVHQWVQKYAKKYRKDFALSDFKTALTELKNIRKDVQDHIEKISSLLKIVNECEEKILEGLELMETEPEAD